MTDYKETIKLPKTSYPMRAGLPKNEPKLLDRWKKENLYAKIRNNSQSKPTFTLHDGPPYANGNLHIGHALNKILKDFVVRSRQMLGFNANYVPGWDCHGLPIEWKIEEQYKKKGVKKDEVPILQFRKDCAEYAQKWVDIQREEFKRLGIEGAWDNPYVSMDKRSDALIVKELYKFLNNDGLYLGAKPVMWSVVEETALAEAEVEYHDKESDAIYLRFKVKSTDIEACNLETNDTYAITWTTTPWTIPANRAMSYRPGFDYRIIQVLESENDVIKVGQRYIITDNLVDEVCQTLGIIKHEQILKTQGNKLSNTILHHPLYDAGLGGYEFDVPMIGSHHVTDDTGTGLVHTAPAHGYDDWLAASKYGIKSGETVNGKGVLTALCYGFEGLHVFKANQPIMDKLVEEKSILRHDKLVHSYPHSWRSKKPLIYRNTPQWFIRVNGALKDKTLDEIANRINFFPPAGKNRLRGMIETRPDWCISRQRAWGVPIALFVNKETKEPLKDVDVQERIIQAFEEHGSDCWFDDKNFQPSYFLGDKYNPSHYDKVLDILDVWFDSGSTHAFVVEDREDLHSPIDVYLEGSDQHRGWFQSSLLESMATRGKAPYKNVVTHGFVLDGKGLKMSKSLGNIISPQKVIEQSGADILRLWVANSDFSSELRVSNDILKQQADIYRRVRNTLRYLLGNLHDFDEKVEYVASSELPDLEKWVLHRVYEIHKSIVHGIENYSFHSIFNEIHTFLNIELSAFYFDVRKDVLYCDSTDSYIRRATRTVLNILFNVISKWISPFLPFTAEETWISRYGDDVESIHLQTFEPVDKSWKNPIVAEKWEKIRNIRRVVTGALEVKRGSKEIGSSLQAHVDVYLSSEDIALLHGTTADLFITSGSHLIDKDKTPAPKDAYMLDNHENVKVVVSMAKGEKCERCWKIKPEVSEDVPLCERCQSVVNS